MPLSKLSSRLSGQPMFQILDEANQLEEQGKEIFHLEIGDTSYPTNPIILDATKKALDFGMTQYVSSSGILELKKEIILYTKEKLEFEPTIDQVLVMSANAAIDTLIRCLLDKGDECLIPNPGFPTYSSVLNYLNFNIKYYDIRTNDEKFSIDVSDIKNKITNKTRLLILNSPSNPTGMIIQKDDLYEIYKLAEKYDFYILSDEVYSEILYDDKKFNSISQNDLCRKRTILINSFSKNFQMSGYRLGYAIGPENVIRKMTLLFETIYSCVPAFVQYAGIEALKNREFILNDILKKYNRTRELVYMRCNEIQGLKCNQIEGAIYAFIDISGLKISGDDFCEIILKEAGVAILPGSYFSNNYTSYIRLNFARDYDYVNKALNKIEEVIKRRWQ